MIKLKRPHDSGCPYLKRTVSKGTEVSKPTFTGLVELLIVIMQSRMIIAGIPNPLMNHAKHSLHFVKSCFVANTEMVDVDFKLVSFFPEFVLE